MTLSGLSCAIVAAGLLLASAPARADQTQTAPAGQTAQAQVKANTKAPDALDLYFANGSAAIRPEDIKLLDKASRLYSEGKPIVMVVSGSADQVGSPAYNLKLSQARADAVVHGLVERGIPAERFQILAKGVSELPVPTGANTVEPRNRRVEITWR